MALGLTPILSPRTPPSNTVRLHLWPLEARDVPAAVGGFTAGGLLGAYFANPDLADALQRLATLDLTATCDCHRG